MKSQLRQVLFLAFFWVLCTAFVIFVPWGASPDGSWDNSWEQESQQEENSDFLSGNAFEKKFTQTLYIGLKNELLTQTFLDFSNAFTKKHWGTIVFLTWDNLSWVDLILKAFDNRKNEKYAPIHFQEDIKTLFIHQLWEFIDQHKDFLPVAFDPAVMVWLPWLQAWLDGLESLFTQRKPKTILSSFSFWLFEDQTLTDQNLLLAQQLEDFVRFNDVGAFSQWVEMNHLLPLQQQKLQELQSRSSDPMFLFHRGLLGIQFWFQSSYPKNQNLDITLHYYPYQYIGLPVRLYGFVINPSTQNRQMIDQFLLDYMDGAFGEGNFFLFTWMMAVFRNQFTKQCGEEACWLSSDFVVLENWQAKIQKFLGDKLLWKTIEKKVQPDLYLRKASL